MTDVAEFIQVYLPDFGAIEQDLVERGGRRLDTALGINQDALPVCGVGILAEIEEQFAKETVVQFGVGLELDFGEQNGLIAGLGLGQQEAVNPKGGLFEFDGAEVVLIGGLGRTLGAKLSPGQFQQDRGCGLE